MKGESNTLWESVQLALKNAGWHADRENFGHIYNTLWQNYKCGRLEKVLKAETCNGVPAYVARVIKLTTSEMGLVTRLQIEGEVSEWEALRKQLYGVALRFWNRRPLHSDTRRLYADDCTQLALMAILQQRYPYDSVSFEVWAKTITLNVCRNFVRKNMTNECQAVYQALPFEDMHLAHVQNEDCPEELLTESQARVEELNLLEAITAKLTDAQNALLRSRFVEEKPLSEVALDYGVAASTIQRREKKILKELNP